MKWLQIWLKNKIPNISWSYAYRAVLFDLIKINSNLLVWDGFRWIVIIIFQYDECKLPFLKGWIKFQSNIIFFLVDLTLDKFMLHLSFNTDIGAVYFTCVGIDQSFYSPFDMTLTNAWSLMIINYIINFFLKKSKMLGFFFW